jgi:hypothetical protein
VPCRSSKALPSLGKVIRQTRNRASSGLEFSCLVCNQAKLATSGFNGATPSKHVVSFDPPTRKFLVLLITGAPERRLAYVNNSTGIDMRSVRSWRLKTAHD